jgi:ferric-dicitrate binding protein FerR (iron transport regulator)
MYIEVIPDQNKPFFVHTSNFNVKVYGTKFNVSNYTGSVPSVVLVEGSVSLQSKDHKELFISPSEKAVYSGSGTFHTQKVDVNQFISWKEGYLTFDKTPMTEVLQQIGRYYNLSFDYEQDVNLQKRTCSGKIYLSNNMNNVMTTIALLTSTQYDMQNNRIYITSQSK